MQKTKINEIKSLLICLPDKDKILAEKFINNRDFESLQFLVNSNYYKAEKRVFKEIDTYKKEELERILDEIATLKYKVDEYSGYLGELLPKEFEDYSITF